MPVEVLQTFGHSGGGGGKSVLPCCNATGTGVTFVPNSTITTVAFDAENFDTDNMHDNVINNSRISIKTAGKYQIFANIYWIGPAAGIRQITLVKNSVFEIGDGYTVASVGVVTNNAIASQDLIIGDFIEVQVLQTSGIGMSVLTVQSFFGANFISL